jgi:hypothetical protein
VADQQLMYRGGIPKGLLLDTPRPVRMDANQRNLFLIGLGVPIALIAAMAVALGLWMRYTAKPLAELRDRGVVTEGRITAVSVGRSRGSGDRAFIDYVFTTSSGNQIHGHEQWGFTDKVGDAIPITYLPDDPSQHVIGEVTDESVQKQHDEGNDWMIPVAVIGGFPLLIVGLILLWNFVDARKDIRLLKFGELIVGRIDEVDANGFRYSADVPDGQPISDRFGVRSFGDRPVRPGDPVPLLRYRDKTRPYVLISGAEWRDPSHAAADID